MDTGSSWLTLWRVYFWVLSKSATVWIPATCSKPFNPLFFFYFLKHISFIFLTVLIQFLVSFFPPSPIYSLLTTVQMSSPLGRWSSSPGQLSLNTLIAFNVPMLKKRKTHYFILFYNCLLIFLSSHVLFTKYIVSIKWISIMNQVMSTDGVFTGKDIFVSYHNCISNLPWLTCGPGISKGIYLKKKVFLMRSNPFYHSRFCSERTSFMVVYPLPGEYILTPWGDGVGREVWVGSKVVRKTEAGLQDVAFCLVEAVTEIFT